MLRLQPDIGNVVPAKLHLSSRVTFECCDGGYGWCLVGEGFRTAVNCVQAVPARPSDCGILLGRLLDAPTFLYFQVLEGTWTPGYQTCPMWGFIVLETAVQWYWIFRSSKEVPLRFVCTVWDIITGELPNPFLTGELIGLILFWLFGLVFF